MEEDRHRETEDENVLPVTRSTVSSEAEDARQDGAYDNVGIIADDGDVVSEDAKSSDDSVECATDNIDAPVAITKKKAKLTKQKSVTFGNVETDTDGVVKPVLDIEDDLGRAQQMAIDDVPDMVLPNELYLSTPRTSIVSVNLEFIDTGVAEDVTMPHRVLTDARPVGHIRLVTRTSVNDPSSLSSSTRHLVNRAVTSNNHRRLRRALRETWDSKLAFFLACLSCTLGVFNINKFSMLVLRYGLGFILEFFLLSILFGIPLFCMYVKLGQYVRTGIISMWYISPAFYGVGITISIMLFFISVCLAIPVTWMISFFRDSFVSGTVQYRWTGCIHEYALRECVTSQNNSARMGIEVASYFHGKILRQTSDQESGIGAMHAENIVFLALLWLVVFFCLSRGLKLYSKVVYVVAFVPVISVLALVVRQFQSNDGITDILLDDITVTMSDGMSWMTAAREVIFTWLIFGVVVMQMACHTKSVIFTNRMLIILVLVTNFVLIIFSCGLLSCFKFLQKYELTILPSSFEKENLVNFLGLSSNSSQSDSITVRNSHPINLMFGTYFRSSDTGSGYHVMRYATEIFPATAGIKQVGSDTSTFWCALYFLTMIFFGFGQQMVVARCVIEVIIDILPAKFVNWRSTITFIICLSLFITGLPLLSSNSLYVIHYVDVIFGSLWWIVILYLLLNIGVFHIKAPDGDMSLLAYIAHQSIKPRLFAVIMVVNWNILSPVILMILFVTCLRMSDESFVYEWSRIPYTMWSPWLNSLTLIIPIVMLLIPSVVFFVLITAAYRRSSMQTSLRTVLEELFESREPIPLWPQSRESSRVHSRASRSSSLGSRIFNFGFNDDPPPKYTPPPSYSSATSKKIMKQLEGLKIEMNLVNISENPFGEDECDNSTNGESQTET